jgi:hypothetical protein
MPYVPSGTGAVTTTVQAKLRQTVSVKDFGAVGNGEDDDTDAIQLAIDTGLPVYFPDGQYKVSSTITNTTNMVIFGESPVSVTGNSPQTNKCGVCINWSGSVAGPVFNVATTASSIFALKIQNIKIYVDKTFTGKIVNINSSTVSSGAPGPIMEIDGLGLYRTPLDYTSPYAPGNSTSIGIYFDLTSTNANESKYITGYKFNNLYFFNLNTGIKIDVVDAVTAGEANYFNSNYFSNVWMYQVYRALDLVGGTVVASGKSEINANTFTAFQIQPGLDSSSVSATGCVRISYNTSGNSFYGLKIWDIPEANNLASSNLGTDGYGFYFINRIFGVYTGPSVNGFAIESGQSNNSFYPQYQLIAINNLSKLRIDSDGVKFNGNTSASSALNYYGQSTFTPVLNFGSATTGITYSTQTGIYTRIGRMVFFSFSIVLTSKGTATGACAISGLPFASGTNADFTVSVNEFNNMSLGGAYPFFGHIQPGNSYFILQKQTAGVSGTNIADTDFTNTTTLRMSGSYSV